MKNYIFIAYFLILVITLSSCADISENKTGTTEIFSKVVEYAISNNDPTDDIYAIETTGYAITTEHTKEAIGGDLSECLKHDFGYHDIAISTEKLLKNLGKDKLEKKALDDKYIDNCGNYSIVQFIMEYDIPRQAFENAVAESPPWLQGFYLPERIDALYSGDMAKINEAFYDTFCAVYHDGEIYDINWILSHNSGEIIKLGLPLDKIKSMVIRLTEFPTFTYNIENWVKSASAEDLMSLGFNSEDMDKIISGITTTYKSLNRDIVTIENKLMADEKDQPASEQMTNITEPLTD